MIQKVFLLVCLLAASSGEPAATDPPETVQVLAGEDVVLPCSVAFGRDLPTVEWSKSGLKPGYVFVYRDGCEVPEMKNPEFRYRTSLITKELKNGNISLRISKVRLADAGTYTCRRVWTKERQEASEVQLVVVAVPEPKLVVTATEGGVVTLQCEATCSLPEPDISFLDERGNDLPAGQSRREPAGAGGECFTTRRNVTLQDVPNRVTCRVHQAGINQTRLAHIILPVGDRNGCFQPAAISVAVTVVLLVVACGLVVLVWRRCSRSAGGGKTDDRKNSDSSVDHELLDVTVENNNSNDTIESLRAEVADLKTQRDKSNDTVQRLESELVKRDETIRKRNETNDTVQRLRVKVADLESQRNESNDTNQRLRVKVADLESQRDESNDTVQRLESEIVKRDETIRKRNETVQRLEAEVADLKAKLRKRDNTKDIIERLESELGQSEETNITNQRLRAEVADETVRRLRNPQPGVAARQPATLQLPAAFSNFLQLNSVPQTRQRQHVPRQRSLPVTFPNDAGGTIRNPPEPVGGASSGGGGGGGGRSRLSSLPGPVLDQTNQTRHRRRHSSPDSSLVEWLVSGLSPENGLDHGRPDPHPDPTPRHQRRPSLVFLPGPLRPLMASLSEDSEMLIA